MRHALRMAAGALLCLVLAACESVPTDAAGPAPTDATPVQASLVGSVPVVDEASGRAYDAIRVDGGITWSNARTAAEALEESGCAGHLASITSAEDNAFIVTSLPGAVPPSGRGFWIGGFQPDGSPEPAGGWTWTTGEPFVYTNWNPGEPNDSHSFSSRGENALHFFDRAAGRWNDLPASQKTPGYVVEFACDPETDVTIDVKGGSLEPRPINPRSLGVVAVIVLTTVVAQGDASDFDAEDVDPESVTLGDGEGTDAPVARRGSGSPMAGYVDADGDGDEDLVLHFRTQELVAAGDLGPGTTVLVLRGRTWDGAAFRGSDAAWMVP